VESQRFLIKYFTEDDFKNKIIEKDANHIIIKVPKASPNVLPLEREIRRIFILQFLLILVFSFCFLS
jgi:hypothetical protein